MKEESSRIWLKLLSVALAIGLWFAVNLNRAPPNQSQRLVEASVTYSTPQNLVLMDPVSQIEVWLQGSEEVVTTLNPQMVGVLLDLSGATAGTMEVPLGPENVFIPKGVEVVSVEPSVINLEFDYRETLQMPVREVLEGEPAAGARVVSRRVTPDQVTATGPRSVLERTRNLTTEPVRLDTHALSFEETVAVRLPHSLITIQPQRVRVRVELELDVPEVSGIEGSSAETS